MAAIFSYISSNLEWIFSGVGISLISIFANIITSRLMKKNKSNVSIKINNRSISVEGMSEDQIFDMIKKIKDTDSNKSFNNSFRKQ